MKTNTSLFMLILVIINIFLIYKIFDTESGIPAYRDLNKKIVDVQSKIDETNKTNRHMSSEIRSLKKDDAYVARLIKRELFYVSDNELMYILK